MNDWLIFGLSALSGAAGAMGLGGGGVLIICLAAMGYSQIEAGGINLVFFIPIAAVALMFHIKNHLIEYGKIIPVAIGGLLGALPGVWLSENLPKGYTAKIFAALLIALGVREIMGAVKNRKKFF